MNTQNRREVMADYDMSIHTNPDARVWAKFYVETRIKFEAEKPGQRFDDEENMIGWFANAMMAMHDSCRAREAYSGAELVPADAPLEDAVAHLGIEPYNVTKSEPPEAIFDQRPYSAGGESGDKPVAYRYRWDNEGMLDRWYLTHDKALLHPEFKGEIEPLYRASPSTGDGERVRDKVIEECAKVATSRRMTQDEIASAIRSLSSHPSPMPVRGDEITDIGGHDAKAK